METVERPSVQPCMPLLSQIKFTVSSEHGLPGSGSGGNSFSQSSHSVRNQQQDLKSCQRPSLLRDCLTLVFITETLSRELRSLNARFPLHATNIAFHCHEDCCKDTSRNYNQCRITFLQIAQNPSCVEKELLQPTQWDVDSDT